MAACISAPASDTVHRCTPTRYICLQDLAGSERQEKTQAQGQTLQEVLPTYCFLPALTWMKDMTAADDFEPSLLIKDIGMNADVLVKAIAFVLRLCCA